MIRKESAMNDTDDKANFNDPAWLLNFSEWLKTTIKDYGYTGELSNEDACAGFLLSKYQEAHIDITKITLKKWFSGESRPSFDSRSRDKMYELCFVLHFNYKKVCDFFRNVYLSRSFNCRSIKEAVYCYCFSNGKDYQHACSLFEEAKKPSSSSIQEEPELFTRNIETDIKDFETDQEFLDYVKTHQGSFSEYNQSARRELKRLMEAIQGSKEDQALVNAHRKNQTKMLDRDYRKLHGFVVKEYFLEHDNYEYLKGQNVASVDFMMSQILGIQFNQYYGKGKDKKSFSKNADLTELIRVNFPSKQSLSDIFKCRDSVSFDAVRKAIVLFHFYSHFVRQTFIKGYTNFYSQDTEDVDGQLADYTENANDQLETCGYGPLYEKNPYDSIFLYSAKQPQPLDAFRDIISDAVGIE